MNIRSALYSWRDAEAKARGVEVFRIFPNATLDAIAEAKPRTPEELLDVKGVGPMKFAQFGRAIFGVLKECAAAGRAAREPEKNPQAFVSVRGMLAGDAGIPERPAYSVAQYLDNLNQELARLPARVRGEVTQAKTYGNAVYFDIKDTLFEGVLSCFMWSADLALAGISLDAGLEVIVEGRAEIYKPNGRFSLRAKTVELVGEGSLRKAYEGLKKKLDNEGLFAAERKRPLPAYPQRIGVVSSRQGAVIHDFLNNLGKFGFEVTFVDSRVEGVLAVRELLAAIKRLKGEPLDALVVIRGGGSLESLQAFNNEHVVRALAEFPAPVICAIGHDKDVPLAQLVSDLAPSTPTACTALLNESWNSAVHHVRLAERTMLAAYGSALRDHAAAVARAHHYFERQFLVMRATIEEAINGIANIFPILVQRFHAERRSLVGFITDSTRALALQLRRTNEEVARLSILVEAHDPLRRLRSGYSIIRSVRGVVRGVAGIEKGDTLDATVADGALKLSVIDIAYDDKETKR